MFGEGCAKELILDLQIRFPAAFEEALHANGYASILQALGSDEKAVRLAAIQAFQVIPDVDDSDMLYYVADHDLDEVVREAALAAIEARANE